MSIKMVAPPKVVGEDEDDIGPVSGGRPPQPISDIATKHALALLAALLPVPLAALHAAD